MWLHTHAHSPSMYVSTNCTSTEQLGSAKVGENNNMVFTSFIKQRDNIYKDMQCYCHHLSLPRCCSLFFLLLLCLVFHSWLSFCSFFLLYWTFFTSLSMSLAFVAALLSSAAPPSLTATQLPAVSPHSPSLRPSGPDSLLAVPRTSE